MKFTAFMASLVLSLATFNLLAKGNTVRITITGGDLAAPIEISDPSVGRFHVWTGPGTGPNEAQGLNVDWSQGVAEPPKGLPRYVVSFVTTRRNPGTYVVHYVIDPATNKGYVYVPGKADPEYTDNTWLIYRSIEGNWFHAWNEWEKFANPLIAKARVRR